MQNVISKINKHLQRERGVILISYENQRLTKRGEKAGKYKFDASDIKTHYGSVEELISVLPSKGFENGTLITLADNYGRGHNVLETLSLNFNEENISKTHKDMDTNTLYNTSAVTSSPSFGLGYTAVKNEDFLDVKIKEMHYNDLKRLYEEERQKVADLKSKIRQLREENHSLKVKLDTAELNYTLKLQQELLNKRSFFETTAGDKVLAVLGAIAPQIVGGLMAGGAVNASSFPPALNGTETIPDNQNVQNNAEYEQ